MKPMTRGQKMAFYLVGYYLISGAIQMFVANKPLFLGPWHQGLSITTALATGITGLLLACRLCSPKDLPVFWPHIRSSHLKPLYGLYFLSAAATLGCDLISLYLHVQRNEVLIGIRGFVGFIGLLPLLTYLVFRPFEFDKATTEVADQ